MLVLFKSLFVFTLLSPLFFGFKFLKQEQNKKTVISATFYSLFTLFSSLAIIFYVSALGSDSIQININLLSQSGFSAVFLKADFISMLFIILLNFSTSFAIYSVKDYKNSKNLFVSLLFFTQFLSCLFFVSQDIITLYLSFELTVVAMFFIIGNWGGSEKKVAMMKFFLYTLFGSLFLLVGLIILALNSHSILIKEIVESGVSNLTHSNAIFAWICIMVGCLIKLPSFPFHTWLPLAHVQAPTGGSMILAAILIKMSGFVILKIVLPVFVSINLQMQSFIYVLGCISVVYASVLAFKQTDIKKVIAYSSVAHMSYVLCGLFSGSQNGINGAVYQMISHGLISAAFFYLVGFIYHSTHTREVADYSGIAFVCPSYSRYFLVLTFASIAVPSTSGFVGEFLTTMAVFFTNKSAGIILAFGALLGAIYMLNLVKKILFSSPNQLVSSSLKDLDKISKYFLFTTIFVCFFIGLKPNLIINSVSKNLYISKNLSTTIE